MKVIRLGNVVRHYRLFLMTLQFRWRNLRDMSKTIFEKVISGQFEGSFVYKDETCVAFMDLNPLNEGHVLIAPIEPVARLTDLNPKTAAHLFVIAQKVLKAIEQSEIKCEGANIFMSDGEIAGQEVPHVHLHVVPRFSNDGIRISFGKSFCRAERTELNRIAALLASI
ncbi:HIT-like protein [compost metagenome]